MIINYTHLTSCFCLSHLDVSWSIDDYTSFNLITLARAVPTSFANCGVIESQILLFIPRNITIFRIR